MDFRWLIYRMKTYEQNIKRGKEQSWRHFWESWHSCGTPVLTTQRWKVKVMLRKLKSTPLHLRWQWKLTICGLHLHWQLTNCGHAQWNSFCQSWILLATSCIFEQNFYTSRKGGIWIFIWFSSSLGMFDWELIWLISDFALLLDIVDKYSSHILGTNI